MGEIWDKIKDKPVTANIWLTIVVLAFVCGIFVSSQYWEYQANKAIVSIVDEANTLCPSLKYSDSAVIREYYRLSNISNSKDSPTIDHPYS